MKKRVIAAVLAGLMLVGMTAGCGKKPKVTLANYKGLEFTHIAQETVDAEIEAVMESYAEWVEVDRAAKEGDTVNINYVGTMDGVAFEGGTNDSDAGYDLLLGSGGFIDGFEDGLIGTVAGQKIDLNLTFPDPYQNNPDYAGKAAVFSVTVNAVKEKQIPELTDAFVKENMNLETVEAFKTSVYDTLNEEHIFNQIASYIMENCSATDLPEDEVKKQKEAVITEYNYYAQMYASMYGMDAETAMLLLGFESTEQMEQYAQEYATSLIEYKYILLKIADEEKIKVSKDYYIEQAKQFATEYGYETLGDFETAQGKDEIESVIKMNLVLEYLRDQSVIVAPTPTPTPTATPSPTPTATPAE